ncbi:MAG TPA: 4Fe-4S dicluster domain-containing protein [Symbiobacteriaceae bacterium]|jgi:hydrogenase-4 component H
MWRAKLRQLAIVFGAGRVTLPYPAAPHAPAAGFRGLPTVDGNTCVGCGGCAYVCPSRLIALTEADGRLTLTADLTRCTYCARCEDVCPTGAFKMTDQFETAVTDLSRLQIRVELDLADCRKCGKPIGTRHMAIHAAGLFGEKAPKDDTAFLCSDCRRRAMSTRMKEVRGRG